MESFSIVTYNILADELSKIHDIPYSNKVRLQLLTAQLESFVASKSIICLQEVSTAMYGSITLWFEQHGYVIYGSTYAPNLGVVIAAPLGYVSRCEIVKLRDCKSWPRYGEITWAQWITKCISFGYYTPPTYSQWRNASYKNNLMVCVDIKNKYSIGTLHMPCSYKEPIVMQTYLSLARTALTEFAGAKPCILAGDFNIKPDTELYFEMLSGKFGCEDYETAYPSTDKWRPKNEDILLSAYKTMHKTEPAYTCFTATNKYQAGFCGTLDYILHTPNINILNCELVRTNKKDEPQPNQLEPSDHIPILATIELVANNNYYAQV